MNTNFVKSVGRKLFKGNEDNLTLDEWNIFHTYTSFLDVKNLNLEELAKSLVENDFAPCVLHKNGTTWFKSDDEVISGTTVLGSDPSQVEINLIGKDSENDFGKLSSYAKESWYQSIQFRINEHIVFEDSFLTDYIRISVGLVRVCSRVDKINYDLYLTIKLHENGVVIVEFRAISPQKKVHYSDFISLYLNLGLIEFESVEVNSAIVNLSAKAYHESVIKAKFHQRLKMVEAGRVHREAIQAIQAIKKNVESGDFTFELAELTHSNSHDTLSSIAQTIFSVVGYVASNPRTGLKYLLFGQKKLIKNGNFWTGRPYTFITRFDGQRMSAKENINVFGNSLGSILVRSIAYEDSNPKQYLSKDYRYLDDYSFLLSKGFSLCIWSKKGVDSQDEWNDTNNGSLIYGQQAIHEFLEYGYIINRMLLQKVDSSKDLKAINRLRNEILDFKTSIKDAPKYGEIREFVESSLEEYEVPDLVDRINQRLDIRLDELGRIYSSNNNFSNRLIAITFGLIASFSLSNRLIEPSWVYMDLPLNPNPNLQSLMFVMLSLIISILLISLVLLVNSYVANRNSREVLGRHFP